MPPDDQIVGTGRFDIDEFRDELGVARSNLDVGTTVWFENEKIRVWEILLQPGERGPFHAHTTNYFWTVVEGSRGLQRFTDGTYSIRDYDVGDTKYLEHSPANFLIHDLENIGDTPLRFVTVELLS